MLSFHTLTVATTVEYTVGGGAGGALIKHWGYFCTILRLEEIITLHDDRFKRPGSLASKISDMAMITCTNIGCTNNSTSIN